MVEKPEEPPSNQAITGIYVLEPLDVFLNPRELLEPGTDGEYQLTDAINNAGNEGEIKAYGGISDYVNVNDPFSLGKALSIENETFGQNR